MNQKEVSIAVLPFKSFVNSDKEELLTEGFTEDLVINFSKFIGLSVISYYSSRKIKDLSNKLEFDKLNAEYLITGSFRKSTDNYRIGVHLIRTEEERVVFAKQYDIDDDKIFDLQYEIIDQVVSVIQQKIDYDILTNSLSKTPSDLAAYEHWLLGKEALKQGSIEADLVAREHFETALQIDPNYGRAYTGISLTYFNEWSCQLWDKWDVSKKGALEYALKALEKDEYDYISLTVAGRAYLFSEEFEKAEYFLAKSLSLNNNDTFNLIQIAFCYMFLGKIEEAIELYNRAIKLNPLNTEGYFAYGSTLYFEAGNYDKAIELGLKVDIDNIWVDFAFYMAAAYHYLGDQDNMRKYWRIYIEKFSKHIINGEKADKKDALKWHVDVNPYKGHSNIYKFRDYLVKNEGVELREEEVLLEAPKAKFIEHGDHWELSYQNETIFFKKIKGLTDISILLSEPNFKHNCLKLMGDDTLYENGVEAIDKEARNQYRKKLQELSEEILEAEEMNNIELAAKYREEYESLLEHLNSSLNISGKIKKTNSSLEKARTAVTWRIRNAIKKIGEKHPELGKHLENSVKTGNNCYYSPEIDIEWEF